MQLPDLSLLIIMVLFWATYAVLRAWVFDPFGNRLSFNESIEPGHGAQGAPTE